MVRAAEYFDLGEYVGLECCIKRDAAFFSEKILFAQCAIAAGVPLGHVHPGRFRRNPLVAVLGAELALALRRGLRLDALGAQIVETCGNAEVRVGLDPYALVGPVVIGPGVGVAVVQRVDDAEVGVVLLLAALYAIAHARMTHQRGIKDARDVGALLVADAGGVRSGGGDADAERLATRSSGAIEHVIQAAIFLRVQLVGDKAGAVQAVLRARNRARAARRCCRLCPDRWRACLRRRQAAGDSGSRCTMRSAIDQTILA